MTLPTDLLLAMVPIGLLVWLLADVAIAFLVPPRFGVPTITRRLQSLSRDYPVIPLMIGLVTGLLLGHFYGGF